MADDLLASLIPYFGCVIERTPEGTRLTGASRNFINAAAITPATIRAPFTLRTVAMTDSTNLQLYWHLGEIIRTDLRVIQALRCMDADRRTG